MNAERALSSFHAPDEQAAEERAWTVVRSAYSQRTAASRRQLFRKPVGVVTASLVLVGVAALSPAGATVGRIVDRALGVRHAARALSSLPAPGRLLVSGGSGTWIVASNGPPRRIGPWRNASWSPHGLYVTVSTRHELAVVNTRGQLQWALTRPDVSYPRWYSPTGYRVAYISAGQLRVVAGNGMGDHPLAAAVAHVAPAWRPGHPYQLAYASGGERLVVRNGDTGAKLWSVTPGTRIRALAWSADGGRLLALAATTALLYTADGRLLARQPASDRGRITAAALSPDGRALALVTGGSDGAVMLYRSITGHPAARRVLAGTGFRQLAWSPDGRWLLVSWPAADQWVFVHVAGRPQLAAVSRIARQFSAAGSGARFPRLDGWCCVAPGAAG